MDPKTIQTQRQILKVIDSTFSQNLLGQLQWEGTYVMMQPIRFPGRSNLLLHNMYPYLMLQLHHYFLWKQLWGFHYSLLNFVLLDVVIRETGHWHCRVGCLLSTAALRQAVCTLTHPSINVQNPEPRTETYRSLEAHRENLHAREVPAHTTSAAYPWYENVDHSWKKRKFDWPFTFRVYANTNDHVSSSQVHTDIAFHLPSWNSR